ncbi:phosphoribosyl-AMP cyclohydrolase [Microbacterium keratanolyticum]|uniref:phosphoribosyl-AMP cyclohydrolase n=1 Tax=Microbacterium keratanolyticum TaxID=67574 RepID=UPI0036327416
MTDVDAALSRVRWNDDGLVAVVVQQWDTKEVLMMAWANADALRETLTSGRATYWSRSRQEYWRKGDTSGHVQHVRGARLDCDGDTVLLSVDQIGVACHTGTRTCFDADDLAPFVALVD